MKRCVMMFIFLLFLLIVAALTERAENVALNENIVVNQNGLENQLAISPEKKGQ